jgi:hypothetical protein
MTAPDHELKKHLYHWMETVLEVPDPARGGWAACPYARQARLDNKITVVSSVPNDFTETVTAHLHELEHNKDVIVICFDPLAITPTDYFAWEDTVNKELFKQDYAVLGQHPLAPGASDDPSAFKMQGLILVQKLSKLNAAAIKLQRAGYYEQWTQEHYQAVVAPRFNKFNVYQHWDPLKVCVVGSAYPPEFFNFIENDNVRDVMQRVARETEEDYQQLISVLKQFGVEVLRPNLGTSIDPFLVDGKYLPPPVCPRDYMLMFGNDFYIKAISTYQTDTGIDQASWDLWRGESWPVDPPKTDAEYNALPESVKHELVTLIGHTPATRHRPGYFDKTALSPVDLMLWGEIIEYVESKSNQVINVRAPGIPANINSASAIRVGKDVYLGTDHYGQDLSDEVRALTELYPTNRFHTVDTGGHADGVFCVVKPGLVISLQDIKNHDELFPGWEVVYIPGSSWAQVKNFAHLRKNNGGAWWLPGEEYNDELTDFVNEWFDKWTGYIEETVFDVNLLVIDEHNVICSGHNQTLFEAFKRHNVTPHVVNFRHKYFWDGGIHCITNDLHREGTLQDYFPDRST